MNSSQISWKHPLISRPISRRSLLVGGSAAALALRTTSPSAFAQTPAPTGDSDAVALLTDAGKAVAALKTFAFTLDTVAGKSSIMQGVGLKSIHGVVQRPADLQADVTATTMLGDMDVQAVAVDGTMWIQNPLDSKWTELGSAGGVGSVLNPDAIIRAAVNLLEDAQITGDETLDGAKTTTVEGSLRLAKRLKDAGSTQDMSQVLADGDLLVTFWINEKKLPVRIEFEGPIFAEDSADVIRRIVLSRFDEPVTITPPDLATPAAK